MRPRWSKAAVGKIVPDRPGVLAVPGPDDAPTADAGRPRTTDLGTTTPPGPSGSDDTGLREALDHDHPTVAPRARPDRPRRRVAVIFGTGAGGHFESALDPGLALDLDGGTQIILAPKAEEGETDPRRSWSRRSTVIRQRVNGSGVSEAEVSRQGDNNIVGPSPARPTRRRSSWSAPRRRCGSARSCSPGAASTPACCSRRPSRPGARPTGGHGRPRPRPPTRRPRHADRAPPTGGAPTRRSPVARSSPRPPTAAPRPA